MSADLISVLVLVTIFAIGTWRPVNMGAVALVAAFLLGTAYFGLDTDDIASGFPASLFITLVGVTFLFALARANGTVDWLVSASVSAVRGRVVLIPWVMFFLAALITGIGAISAATNAILIPIGLAFAQRYRINPMLVGLSILNGTNAGGFSPIAVYFTIVEGALAKGGVQVNAMTIFLATFLFNLALNLVAFTILGGWKLRGRTEQVQPEEDVTEEAGTGGVTTLARTSQRVGVDARITLGLLVALVIGAVGFDLDVGFLALTAAVSLIIFFPAHAKEAVSGIAWNVVLLIGGIVTYISMLQDVGVVDSLGNAVAGINAPLLASLLILLVGGLVSAFASTNAMFGALVPLTVPFVLVGDLSAFAITAAICVASSSVDSSPFSTGGALVVANTEKSKQEKVFRSLMVWGMSMIAIAPIAAWLIFVLPTS
jgi:di/tricarboxylate transporter